jgi:hypothetical protein
MNGIIAQLGATENMLILFSKLIQCCLVNIIYNVVVSHLERKHLKRPDINGI